MTKLFLILCLLPTLVNAGDLERQRQKFLPIYRAAVGGAPPPLTVFEDLRDYPLFPYLRYYRLRPRLGTFPVSEVRRFLADYPNTLLAERLRTEWLRETARAGRWDLYAADYSLQRDPELQCHALAIQIQHDEAAALTAAKALWLVGKSQDQACDPVFAAMRAHSVLTDDLVFARILLAARAGNPQLGQHIAKRYATPNDQTFANLLAQVHAAPAATLQLRSLRHDSPRIRAIVAHGLGRWARRSVAPAYAAWEVARRRYQFTPDEAASVQRELALAAVAQTHATRLALLDEVSARGLDDVIEQHRLREALKAQAWDKLAKWTLAPPRGATTNPLRWRYWHARALEELGLAADATRAFRSLATERDYYGFLASDKLNQRYAMTQRAVAPTAAERARISGLGAVQRAYELYRLGLRPQARAELDFVLANKPKRDTEVTAVLAAEWGWADRAIALLGQIQSYDDLDLRFPLLHKALVLKFARARGLTPALVYSIIRGESAFVIDAQSTAGALGLMQLLPRTGAATAKRLGLAPVGPHELVQADKNIAIGSEYLRQVLRQFNGSFPLAAAGYNAGPSRVRSWLKTSGCVPADIWVDTIPLAETESYVRRALFYAAIYEYRLGEVINPLAKRLADLTAQYTAGDAQC